MALWKQVSDLCKTEFTWNEYHSSQFGKESWQGTKVFSKVANIENSTVIRISFEISMKIAATWKSFTNGDFQKCMVFMPRETDVCQSLMHEDTEKSSWHCCKTDRVWELY